ncbi:MAG TPA: replication initiator protein A [Phenylobacterium sp.]|uniref:replication initiator protein A n=1 Tax=Phenylobacterium sp. TaxID=1871053 RepID=UPI002B48D249|nr:replication initiator protein A [Phenylobacterium sp.]HKR87279.1 replication initiator protein A [Phenylobacterium sp.]
MTDQADHANDQIDLFLPYLADLDLRDQREMMERPFFSLSKSKRLKPIDYTSPDGRTWVHVSANPNYGMATIWDADILIYCASVLNDMKERRANEIPRVLRVMPYDILRSIGRPVSGRSYALLGAALDRLQSTTIKTNIRAEHRREATFSWLDSWSQIVDEKTDRSRGISLALSNWFYEGVLMAGGVLSIDRAYFDITGGRERWLYRVARKHAGGAGEAGFSIAMPTLFEKSGAEGQYRRFKFEVAAIVRENALPGYDLAFAEAASSPEPLLHIVRRTERFGADKLRKPTARTLPRAPSPQGARKSAIAADEPQGYLTDETLAHLREHYRGWDFHALHAEFRAWINGREERAPDRYQSAFIGYVRRYHEKNRHQLKGY